MEPPRATRPEKQLRHDALRIWHAALDAVRSETLVRNALRVEGPNLRVGDDSIRLDSIRRIAVVGAGKAGAGMAAAVEDVLGGRLMEEKELAGWVNVPEDCVRPLGRIHLHGARPAGVNEPTPAGAAGSAEILRLVESLWADDLCLCLISGGGSALMPAPVEAITLDDKLAVTRHLSAAGANIEQLNTVRKQLSRIKGGGLARACRAGRLVALLISDVLGDPLDVIASGPTVEDS
ncbi:MAG: glycerate-2-kinase family protein, partial [Acidobacteriota bacterium]